MNQKAIATQLEVQQTNVEQARAVLDLKQRQQQALSVRAGIVGQLIDLPHQVGEHVVPGTTLAKVVQPDQLKASLKIAETQARDIQIGQPAEYRYSQWFDRGQSDAGRSRSIERNGHG